MGMASWVGSFRPWAPATVRGKIWGCAAAAVIRSVPSVPLISHRNPVPPATASRTWTLAVAPDVRVPTAGVQPQFEQLLVAAGSLVRSKRDPALGNGAWRMQDNVSYHAFRV